MLGKMFSMVCLIAVLSLPVQAGTIYNFAGTVGGQAVDVTVDFTTSAGTIQFAITNNTIGPVSVIQNVAGIDFGLLGGLTGTLSNVSGAMINVAADGTFTNIAGTPDWVQAGPGFLTTALGSSGPDNTLMGAPCAGGTYSCSGGSITGNGPHNPFAVSTLLLNYVVTGATSDTKLGSLNLAFGTGPEWVSVPLGDQPGEVPEPFTFVLVGAGMVGIAALRRRG